jgi:hypothetical protein
VGDTIVQVRAEGTDLELPATINQPTQETIRDELLRASRYTYEDGLLDRHKVMRNVFELSSVERGRFDLSSSVNSSGALSMRAMLKWPRQGKWLFETSCANVAYPRFSVGAPDLPLSQDNCYTPCVMCGKETLKKDYAFCAYHSTGVCAASGCMEPTKSNNALTFCNSHQTCFIRGCGNKCVNSQGKCANHTRLSKKERGGDDTGICCIADCVFSRLPMSKHCVDHDPNIRVIRRPSINAWSACVFSLSLAFSLAFFHFVADRGHPRCLVGSNVPVHPPFNTTQLLPLLQTMFGVLSIESSAAIYDGGVEPFLQCEFSER